MLTFSFDASDIEQRYKAAVKDIALLRLEYESALEDIDVYNAEVERLKSEFFAYAAAAGKDITDNLVEEATAALKDTNLRKRLEKENKVAGVRLNAIDKSGLCLDVIDELEDEDLDEDGYISFSEFKKRFIKIAKREKKAKVNIQGVTFFQVECFESDEVIIPEEYLSSRYLTDNNGNALKSKRNYIHIDSLESHLKACYAVWEAHQDRDEHISVKTRKVGGKVVQERQKTKAKRRKSTKVDSKVGQPTAAQSLAAKKQMDEERQPAH